MARRKQLRKQQLSVLDDLFNSELNEQAVLDKHKVSRNSYNRWLAEENFAEQFSERLAGLVRQSELIIARYGALAAAKLVVLTDSENQETARKACLDIISLPKLANKRLEQPSPAEGGQTGDTHQLSEQTASKLLALLAEEKTEEKSKPR